MNYPEILIKINKLKEKFANAAFETDVQQIDSWIPQAKRLLLIGSLQEHDGVKFLLEKLTGDVRSMDELLLTANSTQLSALERDRVLDRKAFYKQFINFFVSNEKDIEALNDRVDAELENVKDIE